MFRSISGTIDRKKNNLIKSTKDSSSISLIFNKFLNEYFIEYKDLFKWEASYGLKDGKVFITTGSKIIAGELSLKIKELSKLLKEANLKATQIVIA